MKPNPPKVATAAAVSHYPRAYAQEIAYSRYISEINGDNREAYCNMLESISRALVPILQFILDLLAFLLGRKKQ